MAMDKIIKRGVGFRGEIVHVIPRPTLERFVQFYLARQLYVTDVGWFPRVKGHYCRARPRRGAKYPHRLRERRRLVRDRRKDRNHSARPSLVDSPRQTAHLRRIVEESVVDPLGRLIWATMPISICKCCRTTPGKCISRGPR